VLARGTHEDIHNLAPGMETPGFGCQTGGMWPAVSKSASDTFNEIATVRIELKYTDPLIWREVEVPTSNPRASGALRLAKTCQPSQPRFRCWTAIFVQSCMKICS
jgi:hypothetical protein